MPTVGWIQETGEDRFYERGGEPPRGPVVSACPLCSEEFGSAPELSWHLSEAHPLDRPVLMLRGISRLEERRNPTEEIGVLGVTQILASGEIGAAKAETTEILVI